MILTSFQPKSITFEDNLMITYHLLIANDGVGNVVVYRTGKHFFDILSDKINPKSLILFIRLQRFVSK